MIRRPLPSRQWAYFQGRSTRPSQMRTRAPAALEDLRHPSAAHRPMRLRVLARDGDWREPDPPAAATAARGSAAATGRPAAGPDHPPPGRWRHCCPASNRATSAPSRRCPAPPGRSTAAAPAGAIDRRGRTASAVRWAPRSAAMAAQAADSGHESQSRQRRRQRRNASPDDPLLAVTVRLERGICHHDSGNAGHRPWPKLI